MIRSLLADTSVLYRTLDTPIGRLLLAGDEAALHLIFFPTHVLQPAPDWREAEEPFREVVRQLTAYFARELRTFDLPLAPRGTPFQLDVWRALQAIPYGETMSYGELARIVQRPSASRAVGAANGSNPIPIVIPCHRLIGSNGTLTGYGGGLEIKRRLLALERGRDLFADL